MLFVGREEKQAGSLGQRGLGVLLGGLLALGVELMVLLLGALAVSRGIIEQHASIQITAAACVLGCLVGGLVACGQWPDRKLFGGLGVGLACFLFLLLLTLWRGKHVTFGVQTWVELAACLCGGALAGVLTPKGKKKKTQQGRRLAR